MLNERQSEIFENSVGGIKFHSAWIILNTSLYKLTLCENLNLFPRVDSNIAMSQQALNILSTRLYSLSSFSKRLRILGSSMSSKISRLGPKFCILICLTSLANRAPMERDFLNFLSSINRDCIVDILKGTTILFDWTGNIKKHGCCCLTTLFLSKVASSSKTGSR